MSLYYVTLLSACTISLPFLAAMFRMRVLGYKYRPFLILLIIGFLNESISIIAITYRTSNAINANVYVLIEFMIIVWQFSRLNGSLSKTFILIVLSLGCGVWVLDNLVLSNLEANNSLFRMLAAVCIVYISIDKANLLMSYSRTALIKNPDLLITIGFFAYYAFKSFLEAFNVFPMKIGDEFYKNLWTIIGIINIFSNILFTIAILCIQKTRDFTSHSLRG